MDSGQLLLSLATKNNMAAGGAKKLDHGVILRALKSNTNNLSLDNTKIDVLPLSMTKLTSLTKLSAKNNHLTVDGVSPALRGLTKLRVINLGCNRLSCLPDCFLELKELQNIHLFNNEIAQLDDHILECLTEVLVLNLNGNFIDHLPPTISRLKNLTVLGIADNQLTFLPQEICYLSSLSELHVEDNQLEHLPSGIGQLKKLSRLYAQKNKLKMLNPNIRYCKLLRLLDISSNRIQFFPKEIGELKLKEFYYELNPLIPFIPVPSSATEEVLPLKELICRELYVILENDSNLEVIVQSIPEVRDTLAQAGKCLVCEGPFINSWLECVQFVQARKLLPLRSPSGLIPIRAALCSYKCLNSESHDFYGIATPPSNNESVK